MKGIIFTKFVELIEQKWDFAVLEPLLFDVNDKRNPTALGRCEHQSLLKQSVQLSQQTGISAQELQCLFGLSSFENLTTQPESHLLLGWNPSVHSKVNLPNFASEPDAEVVFDHKRTYYRLTVGLGLMDGRRQRGKKPPNFAMGNVSNDGSLVSFKVAVG